jgi:hypothetical protein
MKDASPEAVDVTDLDLAAAVAALTDPAMAPVQDTLQDSVQDTVSDTTQADLERRIVMLERRRLGLDGDGPTTASPPSS